MIDFKNKKLIKTNKHMARFEIRHKNPIISKKIDILLEKIIGVGSSPKFCYIINNHVLFEYDWNFDTPDPTYMGLDFLPVSSLIDQL